MQKLKYTDDNGYKQVVMTQNDDPELGLPLYQFNFSQLDWEQIQRELHNAFIDREIYTWSDLQKKQGLQNILMSVLKPHIINNLKQGEKHYG